MRAPPPVEFASRPGRTWRAATAALAGAAAASPLAAMLPRLTAIGDGLDEASAWHVLAAPALQGGVAVLAGLAVARAVWCSSSRLGARTLRWDGQDWVLPATADRPERRGRVELMIDLGAWLLLRFRPLSGGPVAWLPLTLAGDPARVALLRGALWNARDGRPAGGPRP